jgi:hypothetical protein
MRKITFAAIAAGALVLVGVAGWATPSNRPLQAKASTAVESQIDPFSMMADAKDLPIERIQDFSLVFLPQ